MKITLGNLRDARPALDILFKQELDITLAYSLSKLLKKVTKELKELEEFRFKLIEKYGERDEKTKSFSVMEDKQSLFYTEFGKLLDSDINLTFSKIPLKELSGVKMTANQLVLLEPFIKER